MTPLEELVPLLQWHSERKRQSLDDWFHRQVHERVSGERLKKPKDGWARVRLTHDEVDVSEERWPLEHLERLGKFHDLDKPSGPEEALVVFRGWGRTLLIDGQKRVNYFHKTRRDGEHRVLVVQPRTERADPFPGARARP